MAPSSRTSRLPSGSRRATGLEAWTSAGIAPPTLAPSTSASASCTPSTCPAASEATNSTIATLEWQAQVRRAATIIAISGSALSAARISRSRGVASTGASVCCIPLSAEIINPSPIAARPMFLTWLPLDQRKIITPASSSGGASRLTSNESIFATMAVPTFAPSITASAGASAITPDSVKDTAISPVAVLLCRRVVMPTPAANDAQRLERLRSSDSRSRLP